MATHEPVTRCSAQDCASESNNLLLGHSVRGSSSPDLLISQRSSCFLQSGSTVSCCYETNLEYAHHISHNHSHVKKIPIGKRLGEGQGKCALSYFREEELGIRLGQVLKDIHVPDDVLATLGKTFQEDRERSCGWQRQEKERLRKRLDRNQEPN